MDYYGYEIDEPSDDDVADGDSSSSEDEFESYIREKYITKESDEEEDFDKEMEKELSKTVKKFEADKIMNSSSLPETKPPAEIKNKNTKETSLGAGTSGEKGKAGPSNDDLLYDPDMDDDDEKWVNEQRRAYIYPKSSEDVLKLENKTLPASDAVLNCPGCLTVLCLDCQRHDIYHTQYRAMFVKNCTVDDSEMLKYPLKKKKAKKTLTDSSQFDLYNPVRCNICKTQVAVYDKDEVYHFFNVIASY